MSEAWAIVACIIAAVVGTCGYLFGTRRQQEKRTLETKLEVRERVAQTRAAAVQRAETRLEQTSDHQLAQEWDKRFGGGGSEEK